MVTFSELGISPEIIRAIEELGFESPMPVQEKVIPLLLKEATDIVALAQTGTGKTAAFGLPLIQQIDTKSTLTQALILCPTRELCLQITDDLIDYSKYIDGIKILPVYGGSSIETQINALKRGVHVIVATPGRLIDLMNRKAARLSNVSKVILDEADEMLNMGFTEDLNTILAQIPTERNTLLFSATMPHQIAAIAKNYMTNPKEVTIGYKNEGAENIKHICYAVHAKDKYSALKRIADSNPNIYGIVFCRTRKETQEIADKLMHDGYSADALHGDLSQAQRDFVMNRFRIRQISLLVATDVAARGIDINDLTHVINYNLPDDCEVYTHRSGRTGRAGKKGVSIAIIHVKEKHLLRQIEKIINKKFVVGNVPTGREICEKQLYHFIEKMERVEIDHEQIDSFLPAIYKKLEWIDKEELIKRFVSLEFNRFLEYYKTAKDIDIPEDRRSDVVGREGKTRPDFRTRTTDEGYTRLFINMGKMDGLFPNNLIDLINQNTRGKRINLGKIELLKSFSFFEVENDSAETVVNALNTITFNNRKVSVEPASAREEGRANPPGERGGYKGERREGGYKKEGGFRSERSSGSERPSYRGDKSGSSSDRPARNSERSSGSSDRPSYRGDRSSSSSSEKPASRGDRSEYRERRSKPSDGGNGGYKKRKY
jgi:ATP-dependent RNA helicase DeaD